MLSYSDRQLEPPSRAELKRALMRLVDQQEIPVRLFLLIDGLDEYDGSDMDMAELADFFKSVTASPNVKALISSRPLLVFEDNFAHLPSLRLQDLTFNDILTYVNDTLGAHHGMMQLAKLDKRRAHALLRDIVNASSGVFLWVRLVVRSLLEGLQNFDHLSDLEYRVRQLPPDLEDLYLHMMRKIPRMYLREASRSFRLVRRNGLRDDVTLLDLAFTTEEDLNFAIQGPVQTLARARLEVKVKNRRSIKKPPRRVTRGWIYTLWVGF
jgi:predicted NACHT family NTPase